MNKRIEIVPGKKPVTLTPQISRDTPVQFLKGVGPARARLLEKLGVKTLEDILYFFPWRYEDRKNLTEISNLSYGRQATTMCEVVSSRVVMTPRRRMKIFELCVTDRTGSLTAKWFNQAYLKKYFKKGQKVILSGMVKGNPYAGSGLEMENPDFEILESDDTPVHMTRIIPIYNATEGISPKQLRTLLFNTVQAHAPGVRDYLPEDIIQKNGLRPLQWAISEAHFPDEIENIQDLNTGASEAHRRLIFDEFFMLELGLALMKKKDVSQKGISFRHKGTLVNSFIDALPFSLTAAQKRVIQEIGKDMENDLPMNRLVHGDVGCGKTVVALISMLIAAENNYQSCLMAPTELLAEQHYINIHKLVEALGLHVVLLTASVKDRPIADIASGRAQIVIGTHAIIQEEVKFNKLGLAIIDEQHRFGVMQRAHMKRKGLNPDILIMTATPIPRTLALTLYGDLDVSIIDELPAGRRPVRTKVYFPSQKDRVIELLGNELAKGRQAYIVYPLIEESEKLDLKSALDGYEVFKKIFSDRKVGLVHGRMKHHEREGVMALFKTGDLDLLVSTTVIEVGIDVPNASLMLIVHAERFGLAQLHQLRGRIGRGSHDSYCLLMGYPPFSEEGKRRLKAMELTCDGFKIAEEDLAIRGPGDFFGTRQSGIPELKIANIVRDIRILEVARRDAFSLIEHDPSLSNYPLLRNRLTEKWMGMLELIKS